MENSVKLSAIIEEYKENRIQRHRYRYYLCDNGDAFSFFGNLFLNFLHSYICIYRNGGLFRQVYEGKKDGGG